MIIIEEERTTANSLLDTVTRGVTVFGPIISIGLMNTVGVIHFFTFDAITYLVSIFFIYKLHFQEESLPSSDKKKIRLVFYSIKEFALWLKNQRIIRTLFIVTFIMVFFNTWVWQVGLLLQLIETTPNGKEWYSILLGWYGVAVIGINLIVPLLWRKLNLKMYLIGSIVWGIGIFILGFAYHLPVYFIGVLVAAIGLPLTGLSRVYLLQQYLPMDKLGRGFSFNAFFCIYRM